MTQNSDLTNTDKKLIKEIRLLLKNNKKQYTAVIDSNTKCEIVNKNITIFLNEYDYPVDSNILELLRTEQLKTLYNKIKEN